MESFIQASIRTILKVKHYINRWKEDRSPSRPTRKLQKRPRAAKNLHKPKPTPPTSKPQKPPSRPTRELQERHPPPGRRPQDAPPPPAAERNVPHHHGLNAHPTLPVLATEQRQEQDNGLDGHPTYPPLAAEQEEEQKGGFDAYPSYSALATEQQEEDFNGLGTNSTYQPPVVDHLEELNDLDTYAAYAPLAPERQQPQVDGSHAYLPYLPPPPEEIIAQRARYIERLSPLVYPRWKDKKDTPLRSLYRLYEYLVVDDVIWYRNELEYFWDQHWWAVCDIPDPKDENLSRYAFLACIPRLLIQSFNRKIKMGQTRDMPAIISPEEAEYYRTRPESTKVYEKMPDWANHVPPLLETLVLPADDGTVLRGLEDDRAAAAFKSMNILKRQPHIHFM